jgi:hypothetical protein
VRIFLRFYGKYSKRCLKIKVYEELFSFSRLAVWGLVWAKKQAEPPFEGDSAQEYVCSVGATVCE